MGEDLLRMEMATTDMVFMPRCQGGRLVIDSLSLEASLLMCLHIVKAILEVVYSDKYIQWLSGISASGLMSIKGTDADLLIFILIPPTSIEHCFIALGNITRSEKHLMTRSQCITLLWKGTTKSSWRLLMQQSSQMFRSQAG